MKLQLKNKFNHQLIFDGIEDMYYDADIVGSGKITDYKSIYHLENSLPITEFNKLIDETGSKRVLPFKTFKTIDNFTLMYKLSEISTNKILFIISTGESQPGRYMIFLEGIWELTE